MYRVAVLFAPASLAALAEAVADGFAKRTFEATPKAMSDAGVSHLNGADVVVLVAAAAEHGGGAAAHASHGDFDETRRALHGMNLAGRVAGIVAVGDIDASTAITDRLREGLDASEAIAVTADCHLDGADRLAEARQWVKRLAGEFIELKRSWVR